MTYGAIAWLVFCVIGLALRLQVPKACIGLNDSFTHKRNRLEKHCVAIAFALEQKTAAYADLGLARTEH